MVAVDPEFHNKFVNSHATVTAEIKKKNPKKCP